MSHTLRVCALCFGLLFLLAACTIQPIVPEGSTDAPAEAGAYPMVYAAPDCEYGGTIRSIEAPDARTVRFVLCYPDAFLPSNVSTMYIHDALYLETTGGSGDLLTDPNGTGPLRVVEWTDDQVRFERFDAYWGQPSVSAQAVVHWNEDSAARLEALQAGDVDGINVVDVESIPVVEADAGLQLVTLPPLNVWYLGINNLMPPFDNERVRQAVAMAIDREALVAEFFPPGSLVPTQVSPPVMEGHTEGAEWYPYDPDAARAILEEEGATGIDVELTYWIAGATDRVSDAIAAQLAEVGINATVVSEEAYDDYFTALIEGEIGALDYIAWYATGSALNYYWMFAREVGLEFGEGYPEVWEAIDAAAMQPTAELRQPYFDALAEMIKQHVPMVPLAHESAASAFRADVTGVLPTDDAAGTPLSYFKAGDRDVFHYMIDTAPYSAYCNDEVDVGSGQICRQVTEALTDSDRETLEVIPSLATEWTVNDDLTEWTFTLRDGVTFHDGSTFDADDVVTSYAVMWDAAHPLHTGNTGGFEGWTWLFGPHLNAPQE